MCGLAGLLTRKGSGREELVILANRMSEAILHRGPDDGGAWVDEAVGVALGHRRLSILDLSDAGHQPMLSADGRYVLVYNGEIYNFPDLRRELETANVVLRGHSDTEVLLEALARYGVEATLARLNGMFAFALWNREERVLSLVRDRFGKKPLYFGWVDRDFVFASELKALTTHPGFRNEINREALTLFLRHNCIPAPYSIYEGIFKLPPATVLRLSLEGALRSSSYQEVAGSLKAYWSARAVFEAGMSAPFAGSGDALEERLDDLLREAVRCRMVSDVPLGVFLSGGIDSSLVVALMQVQSERPVKTFTIGFREAAHNEADDARRVAAHLGTDHHELYVTSRDALDVITRLPVLYDEPFSDSSQIPTYLVSKFAREHVTVALTGDGGDEVFGGYNRYVWAPELWHRLNRWPVAVRKAAAHVLGGISPRTWRRIASIVRIEHRTPADKIAKLAGVLEANSPYDTYRTLTSHWTNPETVVIGAGEADTRPTVSRGAFDELGFLGAMMYLDQVTYLPDDILVKVDRASMGVSLETRAPLLDWRVAEFAAKLSPQMKIRERQGKYILRRVLYRYVPRELVERPKMGFEMPVADWLRGPLREWADSLLSEARLADDGYFRPETIREKWRQHCGGRRNWQFDLWDILMFQAWLDETRSTKKGARRA